MKKIFWFIFTSLVILPSFASAHGIGEVYALPVPLKYYLFGAALAVAVSFFIAAVFLNKPAKEQIEKAPYEAKWIKPLLYVFKPLSVVLLLVVIVAGIIGRQNPASNFAAVFFWVYFLMGVSVLHLFVGNLWQHINPWKIISNFILSDLDIKQRYISGAVGVVLLLGLFWWELVSGASFIPRIIGVVLLVYTVVNVLMALRYQNWYKHGELFSVLFGFVGTLAPWRLTDTGNGLVHTRVQSKLSGAPASMWMLGIAAVMLAGASFDSIKESVMWFNWLKALGFASSSTLAGTLGVILAPLPFLAAYLLACWVMNKLVGGKQGTWMLARQFVWSLVPIAFGYTLAHNFALVIVQAPLMLAILSDPFGYGWNLFGTAEASRTTLLLGAKMVWFIEIGFVILAHIFGVLYAHILAVNIFKDGKAALRSQYPMALLMVGFTVFTLWLLSQPLVSK